MIKSCKHSLFIIKKLNKKFLCGCEFCDFEKIFKLKDLPNEIKQQLQLNV